MYILFMFPHQGSSMKLLRDTRTLQTKAIASLKIAMAAFNSFEEEGRICTTLLHLQHACEMLLKGILVQRGVKVFDKDTGMSIGFEKCIRLCTQSAGLGAGEAGIMRAVDSLRDASQHWFIFVSEDLLYMHTKALVTAFDAYMQRELGTDLHSQIPSRVLPVSTTPPGDFLFLVDKEFKLIKDLLAPGKRHRDEAQARIRSLLAMEAMVADEVQVSQKDIGRIERAIRGAETIDEVFPRLTTVSTQLTGEGVTLKVHFSKKDGAPVRFIGGDDPGAAAAIREIDLRKKYHLSASALALDTGLTQPKAKAMRWKLGIDGDDKCMHVFEFGQSKFPQFSDNARQKIKDALAGGIDPDATWKEYRANASA
ncbi:hypothetical protein [Janthinobacterium sp. LM6]|uniref:hypothetical protein n=1 Tax=Janthinobacterium sp. LM6 TaxID=1938606 RepID=UPI001C0AABBC|nr:hypothetical protein [Janthinobacterium sp. LM6]